MNNLAPQVRTSQVKKDAVRTARPPAGILTALILSLAALLLLPGALAQAQTPGASESGRATAEPVSKPEGKATNRAGSTAPAVPPTTLPAAPPAANGGGSLPLLAAPPGQLGDGRLPPFVPSPAGIEPDQEDKRPEGRDWRWSDAPVDEAFGAYQRGLYVSALREAMKTLSRDPNNAASMTLMGELYRDGLGIKPDPAEAVRWYRLADAKGDPNGAFALARAYLEGAGVEQDHDKSKHYFERAAAKNHPAALYNLGIMAMEGEIQDFDKAAALFRRGMALGNVDCTYALALMHRNGQGVEKDEREATRLLKLAADQHHIAAMVDYAIALFNGRGTKPDERGAAAYLIRAAWRNAPVAQNRLARMYLAGRGVKSDLVEAMKWHVLARSNGLKDAWLDANMTKLTEAQREMVEEAVRKFGVR